MVKNLLPPDFEGELLDAAAGGGELASQLAAMGCKVTGIDIQNQWQQPSIPFLQHDLDEKLPFDDSSFDAVILVEAVGYLENPSFTLREFARVLRPGGILIVSMPNIFSLQSRLRFLGNATYRWFPHIINVEGTKECLADTYREPIRLTTLEFLMKRSGFQVVEAAFGGGGVLGYLAPLGWMLQGLSALHNATRKKGRKRTPAIVNSRGALFYSNTAVVAKKVDRCSSRIL
jgi:ubiquinone/menaquinone biosynthesis C-methylase UbiE